MTWGFDCNRLIKLQKKIMRIISCSKYNAHTEPIFKKLGLLKLPDMLKLNTLKFYWKLKKDKIPAFFENYRFLSQENIHGRVTRFNHIIPRNVTRTVLQQKCLRNYIPEILNTTGNNILEKLHTHSYKGFSNYAKLCFIGDYSQECQVSECYICSN